MLIRSHEQICPLVLALVISSPSRILLLGSADEYATRLINSEIFVESEFPSRRLVQQIRSQSNAVVSSVTNSCTLVSKVDLQSLRDAWWSVPSVYI